jgi:hypothetical protein
LDIVKTAFEGISSCTQLSLQLLNIVSTKKNGIGYSCRLVELKPKQKISEFVSEISQLYLKGKKAISRFQDVVDYDGTTNAALIYKLSSDNELISSEMQVFLEAIADPDTESNPFDYNSAYMIEGTVIIQNVDTAVKLISMQNPITVLKHKFLHDSGTFHELSDQVLSLRPTVDVIIIGDKVYFITLAGENLFNMARAYRSVCHTKVEQIESSDIVSDINSFKLVAESGHNPRRFVSFNDTRLEALKDKKKRTAIAKKFKIPLDSSSNKFDASTPEVAEKIVKLLCNKGMLDPFDNDPVEVDGARQWK